MKEKRAQNRYGFLLPVGIGIGGAIGAAIHNIGAGTAIGAGLGTIMSLVGWWIEERKSN